MKIKQAMKYYFSDYTLSVSVFYLVLISIYALITFIALAFPELVIAGGGAGIATLIFLFVLGLNSFKAQFRFFLQNGISRRTQFFAFHISALCLAVGMTLIGLLFPLLFGRALDIQSMTVSTVSLQYLHPLDLLQSVSMYLLMAELGFLVTALYYRMNKMLKLIVSIGVPVLLFVVLPVAAYLVPGLEPLLAKIDGFFSGRLPAHTSYIVQLWQGIGNTLFTAAACGGLSWLLVRKAILKND